MGTFWKNIIKTALGIKPPRAVKIVVGTVAILLLVFLLLDLIFPIDLQPQTHTKIILAANGAPLRAFPDAEGVWRYPVTLNEVSPLYIEALLGYEDRHFRSHPGINFLSMARAAWQWAANGRPISGGSTLTMQVARLRHPVPRTVRGKTIQMFRSLQLEWHFSKDEILTYYLNHAPFGGTFAGVQAASYAYFDHGAEELTHAQAALLTVLPQAPSRYRPDRYPGRAEKARNKCLNRLQTYNIWDAATVADATLEKVVAWPLEAHMSAPLLARRLHNQTDRHIHLLRTLIDLPLQDAMQQLGRDYAGTLAPHVSLAILVMNNSTGAVEAYVGSADFFNRQRFGSVDMVKALRSPGSTLKPFIYGMALDQGLICSQSLLMDVPTRYSNYQPVNFHRSFSGPVSVTEALAQSLNLPAVQLMDHVGPRYFYAQMANAGCIIALPPGGVPNLAMALGGCSTSLENLVGAFSSLGRGGVTIEPRFLSKDDSNEARIMSPGAAWIVQDILIPKGSNNIRSSNQQFAIKTGTSYGFRDAWAIGVDKEYTIGVWTGRPDGFPVPGYFGSQTATPLLKLAFQLLPSHQHAILRPSSVTSEKVFWPGGQTDGGLTSSLKPKTAWVLDGTTPPTLTATRNAPGPAVKTLSIPTTADGKFRLSPGCEAVAGSRDSTVTLWPVELESWLTADKRRSSLIPPLAPFCSGTTGVIIEEAIKIEGLQNQDVIMKKDSSGTYPVFDLLVSGGHGPWYWFENSVLAGEGNAFTFTPSHPGPYQILVQDQSGTIDKITVEIY